ncbi:hypothetical protein [Nonomuraea wenchangensis]|uniref:hypothetical protein n=1 Tax=Nonomuraea wenchangensis TaxID=568860 RepID=UPI0037BD3ABE
MIGRDRKPRRIAQDATASGSAQITQVVGDLHIHHHHDHSGEEVGPHAVPGRPLEEVTDPFTLEIHHSIGSQVHDLPELPVYVPREHDRQLDDVVAQAAAGASQIAVVVGGSSTGKTRACWEALASLRQVGGWRLWHPIDPTRPDATLAELPNITPYTVVWLNEAQFYLADPVLGERVAAGLRELLRDPARGPVLVLATLWPAYWDTLTAHPRSGPDVHAQARELLKSHKIDVADRFTGPDLQTLNDQAIHDPRLGEAVAHAGDGQITQYLAGVPVLLDRYHASEAATKALIWAAMDARRLGCGPRLPLALLDGAARSYLTDAQYECLTPDWLATALAYVTTECNGIRGILIPITTSTPHNQRTHRTAAPAQAAPGQLYRLADYLEQYGRRHRDGQIPPIDFWTAAAAHAHPRDLGALGEAAWARGLYRDAAQFRKHATHSDAAAASALVRHLHALHSTDRRPAHWAAGHAALNDPRAVGELLNSLREAGAEDQMRMLLARDPAGHVTLDNPRYVAVLLNSLREAGAHDQMRALAERAAWHAALDLFDVLYLLDSLRQAGAHNQATVLAERATAQAILDDPRAVAWPVELMLHNAQAGLRNAGNPGDVADLLAMLHNAQAGLRNAGNPGDVADLLAKLRNALAELRNAGKHNQVTALAQLAALLADPPAMVELLINRQVLAAYDHNAEEGKRMAALARLVALNDPYAVALKLYSLRERVNTTQREVDDQVTVLAERAAAHAALDDPSTVAKLLDSLRQAGKHDQVTVLAERAAAHAALDDPYAVAKLLDSLRQAGEHDQVSMLTERLPAAGLFDQFLENIDHQERFRFGREPDGSAAVPWEWEDLA